MRKGQIRSLVSGLVLVSVWLFFSFLIGGCTKEKRDPAAPTAITGGSGSASFATIQDDVFKQGCAISGCHDNRANPGGGLNMSNVDASHSGMVNVKSQQGSGLLMVTPADPDNSYLIHKIKDTHISVGGSGDRMPQFSAAIPQADIDRIITWINNGALND